MYAIRSYYERNSLKKLDKIRDLPFRMLFIGTGYAKDELMEMTEHMGLSSKINFLGVITEREKLKKYYAAANLFLFPSIYDNAPLVLREAAALHTPAVLVNGSSSAENITNNYNGFLIENSAESLANKLRELIKQPELITEAGLHASQTIARSWENVAEEVLDRYQSLMKRSWRK